MTGKAAGKQSKHLFLEKERLVKVLSYVDNEPRQDGQCDDISVTYTSKSCPLIEIVEQSTAAERHSNLFLVCGGRGVARVRPGYTSHSHTGSTPLGT